MKLRNEILSGRIKQGEFILPENTLSKEFKLSRVSIRKGLAELVEEGLIEKIPGKGNRVLFQENQNKQIIKLGWFSTSYETDIVRKIISKYEEQHPFVKVELVIYPNASYAKSILAGFDNGDGPDAFILSDHHFRDFIELNGTDHIEEYTPANFETYETVYKMFEHEERQLAVPFVFSPVVICYNKNLINKQDMDIRTWKDLLSISKENTKRDSEDGIVDSYGFCFSSAPNRWPAFLLQNGGGFRRNGKSVIQEKESMEALQFCVDLMYKHKVSPVFTHGSNMLAEDLFMKERAAMILTTYYFMNVFKQHDLNWDIIPLPEQKEAATLLIGGGLSIHSESPFKEVAKSLVDFMVSEEAQTILKQDGCTIPAQKQVAENKEIINKEIHPENYHVFMETMDQAIAIKELTLTQSEIISIQFELHLFWANMERVETVCSRIQQLLDSKKTVNIS
jgi:multiple sugar transport system substrate-binding protein